MRCTATAVSAAIVRERGGDYILALKNNQSKLFAAAGRRFARGGERSTAERSSLLPTDRARYAAPRCCAMPASWPTTNSPASRRWGVHLAPAQPCKPAEPPLVRYFLL